MSIKVVSQDVLELDRLLRRAEEIQSRSGVEGLVRLQRLVLKGVQAEHMMDAYIKDNGKSINELSRFSSFGLKVDLQKAIALPASSHELLLSRDIVLPTCWRPESIGTLGLIGKGKAKGEWLQDRNHDIVSWYPLNIHWVGGGNHSIVDGILAGEGSVIPSAVYDVSYLYKLYRFNGKNWVDLKDNRTLPIEPRHRELGWVYEIGRMILAK